jgi:hypothetical protein
VELMPEAVAQAEKRGADFAAPGEVTAPPASVTVSEIAAPAVSAPRPSDDKAGEK